MKRINIILAALVLLLTVSCSRKLEFQHETFVTLEDITFSVNEKVGKVQIPVSIFNQTGREVQVTVIGVDGTAAEGVDYEIVSPASGILTFAPTDTTLNVEVRLIPNKALTGTRNFQIQVNSATAGVDVGGFNLATVKILDNEHPLAPMIGEWSGAIAGATGTTYETTFNIEAVDDDNTFTQLRIDSGIDPAFGKGLTVKYLAVASAGKITLQSEQLNGYESYYLQGLSVSAQGYMLADNFSFVFANETLTLANPYAVMAPGVDNGNDAPMEIYYEGVFTKK